MQEQGDIKCVLARNRAELNLEELLQESMDGYDDNSRYGNSMIKTLGEPIWRDGDQKHADLIREEVTEMMKGSGDGEIML